MPIVAYYSFTNKNIMRVFYNLHFNMLKYSGIEIRGARIKFGKTQKEFGELLGVGQRTIQKWESDESDISETAQKLLTILINQGEEILGVSTRNTSFEKDKEVSIEETIANAVLEKLRPYFANIENALAENILDVDDLIDKVDEIKKTRSNKL